MPQAPRWSIRACCALLGLAASGFAHTAAAAEPTCDGDPFDLGALRVTVDGLADPALKGRLPGSAGDVAARAQIEARFRCLKLKPAGADYAHPFVGSEGGHTANIVGFIRGADPTVAADVIVVGAHHDHLGEEDGSVMQGANDNASGVAVMFAVAQALAQRDKPLARTVVFVAFGSEEDGFDGSADYVEHPPAGLSIKDTVFMVNLDMVGRYDDENTLYALHTFSKTPGRIALDALRGDFPDLNIDLGSPGKASDHLSFCEEDVPVTFFFTDDSRCYHKPCDTPDKLDYKHMASTARLVTALVTRLADPALDLRAARQEEGCGEP